MHVSAQICLAYYSFDCHLLDGSLFMRHGRNVNGVMFESIVAQKNFSAVFNGTNYVTVSPFRNIRPGSSSVMNNTVVCMIFHLCGRGFHFEGNSSVECFVNWHVIIFVWSLQQYSPDLTVVLWVYTQGNGDMSILSTGVRNSATLGMYELTTTRALNK